MVARGCGSRSPGGAYLVCDVGPGGVPVEALIIDPPRIMDPDALGLAPQGITLAVGPEGKDAHLIDWVGEKHYPNVADFVEEAAVLGTSRRVPSTFDFAKIGPRTKHLLVHPRASVSVGSVEAYGYLPEPLAVPQPSFLQRALLRQGKGNCPFNTGHEFNLSARAEVCAAWWWEWLQPKTLTFATEADATLRQDDRLDYAIREMPAFSYAGYVLPDGWRPDWRVAAFMALPVSRIEVIRDPLDGTHELVTHRARRGALPVEEVDE